MINLPKEYEKNLGRNGPLMVASLILLLAARFYASSVLFWVLVLGATILLVKVSLNTINLTKLFLPSKLEHYGVSYEEADKHIKDWRQSAHTLLYYGYFCSSLGLILFIGFGINLIIFASMIASGTISNFLARKSLRHVEEIIAQISRTQKDPT